MQSEKKSKRISRSGGFTLVEVIVVLVILGILAAMLIPSMMGWIDKSRGKQCQLNRAELMMLFRTEQGMHFDEKISMSGFLSGEYSDKAADLAPYACPDGGTFNWDEDKGQLFCSIASHNSEPDDSFTGTNMDLIGVGMMDIIHANMGTGNKSVDSGATKGKMTTAVLSALEDAGIDLNSMNIKSWSYKKASATTEVLMWTSVDIASLEPNTTVPVLRYNTNGGTYTVWKARVTSISSELMNGEMSTYNILMESTEYPASKALPASQKKDYAQAKAWFDDAIAAEGL